jgi:hypothetical protein
MVTVRDFSRELLPYPQTTLPLLTETHDMLLGDARAADVVRVLFVAAEPVQSMCIALTFNVLVFMETTAN